MDVVQLFQSLQWGSGLSFGTFEFVFSEIPSDQWRDALNSSNSIREETLKNFKQACKYDPRSYALDRISKEIFDSLPKGGGKLMSIPNRCCTLEHCPQYLYRRLLVEEIARRYNITVTSEMNQQDV